MKSSKSSGLAVGSYSTALSVTIRLSALVVVRPQPSARLLYNLHADLQYNYAYALQFTRQRWGTESYWPIDTAWDARRPKSEIYRKYNPRPQKLRFGLSGHFLHNCTSKHTVRTGRRVNLSNELFNIGKVTTLGAKQSLGPHPSSLIKQQPCILPQIRFPGRGLYSLSRSLTPVLYKCINLQQFDRQDSSHWSGDFYQRT